MMIPNVAANLAAAHAAAAEKRLVERLRAASARDAGTAVRLDLCDDAEIRQLRVLVRAGIVHAAPDGRVWVDEDALAARAASGRRAARWLMAAVLLLGIVAAALTLAVAL